MCLPRFRLRMLMAAVAAEAIGLGAFSVVDRPCR